MSVKTKIELRDDVLRKLNVLAAGQVASAEDAELVEARIESVLDELDDESLLTWDVANDIPGKAYLPLVAIVAYTMIGDFGQQARAQELASDAAGAERRLRRQAGRSLGPSTVQATYY